MADYPERFKFPSCSAFLEYIKDKNITCTVKRLSGNDTGITRSHQVGIYLSENFCQRIFPEVCTKEKYNPKLEIKDAYFPCHDVISQRVIVTYYNNKFHPEKCGGRGTRNEFRMTSWGGRDCPVQNPECTGSIWVAAYWKEGTGYYSLNWVTKNAAEEDLIENFVGELVEPGRFYFVSSGIADSEQVKKQTRKKALEYIPEIWFEKFPNTMDVFGFILKHIPFGSEKTADTLLLKRRELEFAVFSRVEESHVMKVLEKGFDSVEEHLKFANSVTNRRKARSGKSLEHNLAAIFTESGIKFEEQVVTEVRKKPDFIFPSGEAYHAFPNIAGVTLYMLAAKTCCKDRWRQVCTEAAKIKVKHLFTLQEGISENQLDEMRSENVALVIPEGYRTKYPESRSCDLLSLAGFIDVVKMSQV